jgi:hypothetical protein
MEQKYAIIAKKIALLLGLVACLICFMLFYNVISKTKEPEVSFACGNARYSYNENSEIAKGKTLFINNCAQCHNKNMRDRLTGPPLHFWKNYFKDETEIWAFLKDSRTYLKKTKNRELKKLHKEYDGSECVNFPTLSLLDVQNILLYVNAGGQILY